MKGHKLIETVLQRDLVKNGWICIRHSVTSWRMDECLRRKTSRESLARVKSAKWKGWRLSWSSIKFHSRKLVMFLLIQVKSNPYMLLWHHLERTTETPVWCISEVQTKTCWNESITIPHLDPVRITLPTTHYRVSWLTAQACPDKNWKPKIQVIVWRRSLR